MQSLSSRRRFLAGVGAVAVTAAIPRGAAFASRVKEASEGYLESLQKDGQPT